MLAVADRAEVVDPTLDVRVVVLHHARVAVLRVAVPDDLRIGGAPGRIGVEPAALALVRRHGRHAAVTVDARPDVAEPLRVQRLHVQVRHRLGVAVTGVAEPAPLFAGGAVQGHALQVVKLRLHERTLDLVEQRIGRAERTGRGDVGVDDVGDHAHRRPGRQPGQLGVAEAGVVGVWCPALRSRTVEGVLVLLTDGIGGREADVRGRDAPFRIEQFALVDHRGRAGGGRGAQGHLTDVVLAEVVDGHPVR